MKVLIFAAVLGMFLVIAGDRPERRPGNLAPIQLISAMGAWALVFANASALAIAMRDGSLLLFYTAAATLTIAVISFVRDGATRIANGTTPESVKRVVDDLAQLLGAASRLGIESIEAVVVDGHCPGIGVAVGSQGRVTVRVRSDVVRWLEGHQRVDGARAALVASFVRFTVLHELGHVLNGDHRTFRFVRSVLVAHLVWIASVLAAAASFVVNGDASVVSLAVAGSIVLPFAVQSLVARRFLAERERLADWRAMQTLAPADTARLLERRGQPRATPYPTELEKLMIALKAQAPPSAGGGVLSWLVARVWPEGDDIHQRSEKAAGDRAGGAPQPVRWAALVGMQCGLLSMSAALAAIFALAPWMGASADVASAVMLPIMFGITAPAVMFCEMRVDPKRVSVRRIGRAGLRILVGLVFLLAFVAAAVVSYRFQIRFGIAFLPSPFHFAGVLAYVTAIVIAGVWTACVFRGSDGGGELRDAPRSDWVQMYPGLVGLGLILFPLSVVTSDWLAIGSFRSWQWVPLMLMSFGAFVVSTGMARSTNATLRAIAPMALLAAPVPVYGFRVFWRDFYIDLSQTTLPRATAVALAVQLVTMPFFVLPTALLMQQVRAVMTEEATFMVMFVGSFAVFALFLVIPDGLSAYDGPRMRLLFRERLQLFERLLAAARMANPPVAEQLTRTVARWLRNDAFPGPLLPDEQSVWRLAPLLSLMRLARATDERTALERWRDSIEHSLRRIIADDSVAVAPGQPPSMYWTTLAATVIDEASLREAFPFERMLDRIESLLHDRLARGTGNLLTDVVSACRLLRRWGRTGPDAESLRRFARSSSLVSRPLLRQSLAELCELAELSGDGEWREKLGPIVRSRAWEALQLNPRKDVLLLLDCYLAAACLGETDPREESAAVIVAEIAERVSNELHAIENG